MLVWEDTLITVNIQQNEQLGIEVIYVRSVR